MRIIVYLAPILLVLPLIPGFIAKVHAQDNATVATVNGETIEQSTVDAVSRQLQARQQQVDEAAIVEELINMKLLSQLAAESGIDKRDDVKSAIELQRLQLLANAYMREMSESIEVSDEVLQAEYDRQVAGLSQSEFLVSQILFEAEDGAVDAIKSLDDGGEFEKLAMELSIDPSGRDGGSIGWVQAEVLPPQLADAIATIAPGTHGPSPVKTDFGWHVLRVEETRGTPVPPFESVKPQVRNALITQRLQEQITELRESAEIKLSE